MTAGAAVARLEAALDRLDAATEEVADAVDALTDELAEARADARILRIRLDGMKRHARDLWHLTRKGRQ